MKYYIFHLDRGLLVTQDLGYTARVDEAREFSSPYEAKIFLVQYFPIHEHLIRIQGNEVRYRSHLFPGQYLARTITLDEARIVEAMVA